MFSFFKKKEKKKEKPALVDLDQNPLQDGDMVECLRYEMGLSKVIETENGIVYESIASGKQESWLKMIDASTEFQKVKKVMDDKSGNPDTTNWQIVHFWLT